MANKVFMDTSAVRNISKNFNTVHEVLSTVAKVMEALIMILKTTAFIGLVGGYAVAQYLETIKPYIEDVSQKCANMSKELITSVDAYERGDQQGATRFY